jgi:hypothetical protein
VIGIYLPPSGDNIIFVWGICNWYCSTYLPLDIFGMDMGWMGAAATATSSEREVSDGLC